MSVCVCVCVCVCVRLYSRCLQHDFTDAGHGAETVCRVLQWKSLVLQRQTQKTTTDQYDYGLFKHDGVFSVAKQEIKNNLSN